MKKLLALLLILVITFAFVACADNSGEESGEPQLPGVDTGYDGNGSGVDTDPIPIPPESLIDINNANK